MPYFQFHDAHYQLASGETRVGRGPDADIRLSELQSDGGPIGSALAVIAIAADGSASLCHSMGEGGVFVNGVPVGREPASLLHGDRVSIDGCDLRFADDSLSGDTQEMPTMLEARFATPSAGVGEARSRGRLVSLTDGREYAVPADGIVLGREAGCDIVIAAPSVSRRHARIGPAAGGYEVMDTSTNGVLVNGARVQGSLAIARGDTIRIGPDEFRFYAEAEASAPILTLADVPSLQSTAAIAAVKRPIAAAGVSMHTASPKPAPARRALPLAMLEVLNEGPGKGHHFELASPLSCVGRGEHNDVVIHDESVSESHAKIQRREDAWYIVDMDSTNGSYVGGARVVGEARLTTGSDVRFGGVKLAFRTMGGAQRPSGGTRVIVGIRAPDPKRAEEQSKELARAAEQQDISANRDGSPAWLWVALAALVAFFVYLVLQGR